MNTFSAGIMTLSFLAKFFNTCNNSPPSQLMWMSPEAPLRFSTEAAWRKSRRAWDDTLPSESARPPTEMTIPDKTKRRYSGKFRNCTSLGNESPGACKQVPIIRTVNVNPTAKIKRRSIQRNTNLDNCWTPVLIRTLHRLITLLTNKCSSH